MIGIDEAGRGAWAGPMTVAGCYFTENPGFIKQLNDSKLLTRNKREELEPSIKSATHYKVVVIAAEQIDAFGLTDCLRKAVYEIVEVLPDNCPIQLDGSYNFLRGTAYEQRVHVEPHADARYPAVMAASILAKVERDRIMRDYGRQFPLYGFDTHVGYGTKAHHEAIIKYGLTSLHRRSFRPIKELL